MILNHPDINTKSPQNLLKKCQIKHVINILDSMVKHFFFTESINC